MSFRSCVILFVVLTCTKSAFIQRRNIPVEIVYNYEHAKNMNNDNVAKRHANVEENLPLGTKNLHEKLQLSGEQEVDAAKHIPQAIQAALVQAQLPENVQSDEIKPEEPSQNHFSIINTAEEIVYAGLNTLKTNIDKASASLKYAAPNEESWRNFNKTVQDFFKEQYRDNGLRQEQPPTDNQNGQNQIIQNIVNGFQNLASNFVQGLQQNNQQSNSTEDEQQPGGGFFQNFVNQFSGGVQQISNTINNLNGQSSTSNTVLGDTGVAPTQPPNFINNVISSVQQFFNQNQGSQGGNLSDTGVAGGGNFFQGAINNINQAFNNIRPTPPSGSQGDEGTSTTQRGPIEIIQTIGNQISSFFGQGQGSSSKPPEDETTQSSNFIQNIGQTIQGANPFGQGSGSNPLQGVSNPLQGVSNPLQGGSNPLQGISNPLQGGSNPLQGISNPLQGGSNPLQGISNPLQGGSNPLQGGSNPLTQGVQQINNQIQQFVGSQNGTNPVESIQNALSGSVGGSSTQQTLKAELETKPEAKKTETL